MPDLAGGPVLADQRPAVDHDAAADAGRDGDVDDVARPRPRRGATRPSRRRSCRAPGRWAGRSPPPPARRAGCLASRPGSAAQRRRPARDPAGRVRRCRRRPERAVRRRVLRGRRARAQIRSITASTPSYVRVRRGGTRRKVGADVGGADLGSAEIDRQDRLVGCLIHRAPLYPGQDEAARRRPSELSDDAGRAAGRAVMRARGFAEAVSAADLEHLGAAHRTGALGGRLAVLHRDLLSFRMSRLALHLTQ